MVEAQSSQVGAISASLLNGSTLKSPFEDLIPTPPNLQPLIDLVYQPTTYLSKVLDLPTDQLMYIVAFTTAILSGWILNNIYNVSLRRFLSLVMGCTVQMYMYGKGFLPSISFVVISYLVMMFFPRKQQHYVVFVVNAVLLGGAHIHKMYYYYGFWGAEVTQVMMMNLCKISAISINYRDGAVPKEKRDTELKSREREYLAETLPSFYDYLGYMYYCGGTIAGPFFEFKDFINFIERTGHYSLIPSTISATVKRVSHAIFFIIVTSLLDDTFSQEYLISEAYAEHSFVYKYAYALCVLKLKIFKYYTAFCLIDSATVASGLSYNGIDENSKNAKFNRVETVRVWDIEFSYDVKDFLDAWNISVHKWLKYYVYLRLINKNKKGVQIIPILTTFVVSAIWHGFYPGYYLFFISSGLMDYTFKLGGKLYVLFDFMPLYAKRFALFAISYIQCAYWGLSFVLLDMGKIHKFHSALYYSMHFILLGNFIFLQYSGIIPYCKRIEQQRDSFEGPKDIKKKVD